MPAWGGSARLPRTIGRAYTLDMILRGRKIDGAEAYRIGLVTELMGLEQLKGRAQALGEELASQPRLAIKCMLDNLVGFDTKSLDESMADEMRAAILNRDTADAREGMMAFMEKRKPVFNQS